MIGVLPLFRLTETARLLKNVKSAFKRPTRVPLEVEMRRKCMDFVTSYFQYNGCISKLSGCSVY